MNDCMTFPDTVEEFMEQYKVVDTEHIYTNGSEFVPIFRMKQWFEHLPSAQPKPCEDAVSREAVLSMIDTYMNKSVELHYLPTSDGIKKLISILPSVQPDTTTHDSIPAETGKNDGDGTSGDCINRQAALETIRTMQTYKLFAGDDMILIDKAQVQTELMMLPSAQPKQNEMIKEIRRWINSGNRGNADYFIVDRIEEIINEYEIN